MLDMTDIMDRLDLKLGSQATTPVLARISASINVEQAVDGVTALPAAFVLPGAEGVENSADPWQPRQVISEQVTIILVVRNVSDSRGEAAAEEMRSLSDGVKEALVGFRPENRGPLVFQGASPVGFDDQLLIWSETFVTRRTLVPQ